MATRGMRILILLLIGYLVPTFAICHATETAEGKILFTSGNKLRLIDRTTKAIVWESVGLNGANCVSTLPNGQFLVCERKSIAKINENGKLVARTSEIFQLTTDVKPLANNHFLICDGPGKRVVEMDWSGNINWSVGNLHHPSEAIRLESGNTLVADGTALLKEFDSKGKQVHTTSFKHWVSSLYRLSDGSTLVGQSTAIEFVSPEGRSVWSLEVSSRITSIQQISSTEFLVCEPDDGRIVIMDINGNVTWELSGLRYPWRAIYLQ